MWVWSNFQQEANNATVINALIGYCILIHKGAITEVILVYDLNAREFSIEMPNSLGNFAWGCQIPCSVGDTKSTEGVLKSLGDLTRGCQILGDYSPVAINFGWLWWSPTASEALPYGLN